jgi:hypothetical protein
MQRFEISERKSGIPDYQVGERRRSPANARGEWRELAPPCNGL